MVLDFFPGDKGVVCQEVRETEGFNVLLEARRYGPLVPPELVSLQIRSHVRKDSLDIHEPGASDLSDLLAGLGPLGHDPVEEENESLGGVRDISAGLIKKRGENETKRDDGSGFLVERKLLVDLDQFLSRILKVVELRSENVKPRLDFLL